MIVKLKESVHTNYGTFVAGEHDVTDEVAKVLVSLGAEKKGKPAGNNGVSQDTAAVSEATASAKPENTEDAANQGATSTENAGENANAAAEGAKDKKGNKAGKGSKKSGKKG